MTPERKAEIREALEGTPPYDRDTADNAIAELLDALDEEEAAHAKTAKQLVDMNEVNGVLEKKLRSERARRIGI